MVYRGYPGSYPPHSGSNVPENAEGTGDTCNSPPPSVPADILEPVDWANLIILPIGSLVSLEGGE